MNTRCHNFKNHHMRALKAVEALFLRFAVFTLWLLSLQGCAGDCTTAGEDEIVSVIKSGYLSKARLLALENLHQSPGCKKVLSNSYKNASDQSFTTPGYLEDLILRLEGSNERERPVAKQDNSKCKFDAIGSLGDPTKEWDECCSILPQETVDTPIFPSGSDIEISHGCQFDNPCCEFFTGSKSYLRLPALHEPALRVRISIGDGDEMKTLDLEQDGYLRPFDVAGILWPSGYLLTQCMSNPVRCQIPEIHQAIDNHRLSEATSPIAIELGSGIGAASISFSLYLKEYLKEQGQEYSVLATDIAPHALALTSTNAYWNDANVNVHRMNHTNITSVMEVKKNNFSEGISIVFGSSLQALFHETQHSESALWVLLEAVFPSDKNNMAVAIFVHTKSEPLLPPEDGRFVVVRRIGGESFSMNTRWGDTSDFEVIVLKRRDARELNEL